MRKAKIKVEIRDRRNDINQVVGCLAIPAAPVAQWRGSPLGRGGTPDRAVADLLRRANSESGTNVTTADLVIDDQTEAECVCQCRAAAKGLAELNDAESAVAVLAVMSARVFAEEFPGELIGDSDWDVAAWGGDSEELELDDEQAERLWPTYCRYLHEAVAKRVVG